MDLVDEQDVALFEIGEQRREVAGLGDHRPRGGAEIDAELARDDLRQRGLAEARRADEQHVIERFVARPRRLDEDRQVRARLLLADELGQPLRPQRGVRGVLLAALGRRRGGGAVVVTAAHSSSLAAVLVRQQARRWRRPLGPFAPGHDHAGVAVVVPDQLAASAARRHHHDGLILFVGRRDGAPRRWSRCRSRRAR